eukprot:CAMPEP_0176426196 /NCGR_PEP_ID=MMETSP0127-20121128/11809_1 /TAXON_ID=938130 /ORGANISM="Platyophrya macrostoma, Strain WH" /LENGTH=233 /DNA_ID=CAMNT_0017807439 /DNA_START=38 /DNA_END=739 /DNA_ORIENTATION=-
MQETLSTKSDDLVPSPQSDRSTTNKRIAICGNIGVGKSTICELLARETKGKRIEENFAENPYLEAYYSELQKNTKPNKYAFGSQLFFLKETFDSHQITTEDEVLIFDRSLHENIGVFAESLVSMEIMSEFDAQLYRKIAGDYLSSFKGYDAFVYLKTDEETLLKRIRKRGREMESSSISASYLAQLNKLYDAVFENLNQKKEDVIVLNTTELSEKETLDEIIKELKSRRVLSQ